MEELWLVHLVRSQPLSVWAADSLQLFDIDVRQCFKDCFVLYSSDSTWQQAQLGLCYGCFDLCFLSHHSCAAYIASVCSSSLDTGITSNLPRHFGALFKSHALPSDAISAHSVIFQRSLMYPATIYTHMHMLHDFLVLIMYTVKSNIITDYLLCVNVKTSFIIIKYIVPGGI